MNDTNKNIQRIVDDYNNKELTVQNVLDNNSISTSQLYKVLALAGISLRKNAKSFRWTVETIKEEAKQYKFRSDWSKRSNSSYCAAKKHNIFDECCAHMSHKTNCFRENIGIIYAYVFSDSSVYIGLTVVPKRRFRQHQQYGSVYEKIKQGYSYELIILEEHVSNALLAEREIYWISYYASTNNYILMNKAKGGSRGATYIFVSDAKIKQSALKYSTRTEWAKQEPKLYGAAVRRKILNKCCMHMQSPYIFWSAELVIKEAKKYNSIGEWQKSSKSSYNFALQTKILSDCTRHMKLLHTKWSEETIIAEAKKYRTTQEWRKAHISSYSAARRFKILDVCTRHMSNKNKKWTKEKVLDFAKRFNNITEWINASSHSYLLAQKYNIVDECIAHMK